MAEPVWAKSTPSRPTEAWASRRGVTNGRACVGEVDTEPSRRGMGLEAGGVSRPPAEATALRRAVSNGGARVGEVDATLLCLIASLV